MILIRVRQRERTESLLTVEFVRLGTFGMWRRLTMPVTKAFQEAKRKNLTESSGLWAVVLTKEALAALSPPSRGPVLLLGFDNSSSAPLGAGYYLLWECSVVPPVYPRNCLWCCLPSPGLSQAVLPTCRFLSVSVWSGGPISV